MKKQFALIFVMLISFGLSAQFVQDLSKPHSVFNSGYGDFDQLNHQKSPEAIDTIWTDDFSYGSNWDYVGGPNKWNIVAALPASLINQGFDSLLNSTGNFAFIESESAGPSGTQDFTIKWDGSTIDCSAYPHVRLSFITYLRQFQETRQVLVSNDGGTVWDTIPVLTQFTQNTTSPNGYVESVDISGFAGGQSNVLIMFRYVGAYDWFWCIDDVKIISVSGNDMALNQEFYNGVNDATYSRFYASIPKRQADTAMLKFGVSFANGGGAAQTNVNVVADVSLNGSTVYNDTVKVGTLDSGIDMSANFDSLFNPNLDTGMYNISFELTSDSTDENPSDNTINSSFEVTVNQYKVDNDIQNTASWYDVNHSWEMLVRYEIFADDTAVAVSVFFPFDTLTGRGVSAGDTISYYVYESSNLVVPITQNEGYKVQTSDENGWITLPMTAAKLTPGFYYVGFKVFNDSSSVGSNATLNTGTPPQTVLLRKDVNDLTNPWLYTTEFTPFVRMYTRFENICDGVNIAISNSVNDSISPFYIDIDVTGGTPPYSYLWTWKEDTNTYHSISKKLTNLPHQNNYAILVTDVFGCTGTDTIPVGGIVSVKEISNEIEMKVFPNPNSGTFNVEASGIGNGYYSLVVRDILGKVIYTFKGVSKGVITHNISVSYLPNGIYLVEIRTEKKVQTVKMIVQ